jgi:uncharacterized protein YtpQ (UPF0354 family)
MTSFKFTELQRAAAYKLLTQAVIDLGELTPGQIRDLFLDNLSCLKDSDDAQLLKDEMDNTPYYILES